MRPHGQKQVVEKEKVLLSENMLTIKYRGNELISKCLPTHYLQTVNKKTVISQWRNLAEPMRTNFNILHSATLE